MSVYNAYMALSGAIRGQVLRDERLSRRTSYRIGGPADLVIRADDYRALVRSIEVLDREGVRWTVLGKGTNLLVADAGWRGAVIYLGEDFSKIDVDVDEACIRAGAAALSARVLAQAAAAGLSGLEFMAGVPGTVGGALRMNAGTKDEWISSALRDVVVARPGAGMHRYQASDLEWGYRMSSIPEDEIVLEATLDLRPAPEAEIKRGIERLSARRRRTQPMGVPCCGSVFRNPEGQSAAELLEACGLKGMRIGDAQVSEGHANFVVNTGAAKAADVAAVIDAMHDAVLERFGVKLQREVRYLGL